MAAASKSSAKEKKPKRVLEIEDLLMRLRAIEQEMPVQDKDDKKKQSSADRFLEAKQEFLIGLNSVKEVSYPYCYCF